MSKRLASRLEEVDDEYLYLSDDILPNGYTNRKKKRGGKVDTHKMKQEKGKILEEVDKNIRQVGMRTLSIPLDEPSVKLVPDRSSNPADPAALLQPTLSVALGAGSAQNEMAYASSSRFTAGSQLVQGIEEAGFAPLQTTSVYGHGMIGEDFKADNISEAGFASMEMPVNNTHWIADEWLQILFESTDKSLLRNEVRQFIVDMRQDISDGLAPVASEELDEFLNGSKEEWVKQCPELDVVWEKYAPRLAEISGCNLAELVKPSGPLRALLCIVWHYPTTATAKQFFGMTLDPSNPCLRMQVMKIGMSTSVLTHDVFPIRMEKPVKGNPYDDGRLPWWEEFKAVALQLQTELCLHAKIRIVLGKENNDRLNDEMRDDKFTIVTPIDILLDNKACRIYNRRACMFILQERSTMKIQQIVLPSYHLEYFYHNNISDSQSRLCDMVWNIAGACMGLSNVNSEYFSWKTSKNCREPQWDSLAVNALEMMFQMLAWEQDHEPIPEEIVRKSFHSWLSIPTNVLLLNPTKGTLVKQIHLAMVTKGLMTRKSEAWQTSEGKQRLNASLRRISALGVAAKNTEAWKSSAGRHRVLDALVRGRATGAITQKSEAWQTSEGKAKALAAGRKGSLLGHATMQSEEWKSSEARKRRDTALVRGAVKGRATQNTQEWQASEGKKKQVAGGRKGVAKWQAALKNNDPGVAEWRKKNLTHITEVNRKRDSNSNAKWDVVMSGNIIRQLEEQLKSNIQKRMKTRIKKTLQEYKNAVTLKQKRAVMQVLRGKHKFVFYSKRNPSGIRYKGDGGPDVKEGDEEMQKDDEENKEAKGDEE